MEFFLIFIGICLSVFIVFLVIYLVTRLIKFIISIVYADAEDFVNDMGAGCFLLTICIAVGLILVVVWSFN